MRTLFTVALLLALGAAPAAAAPWSAPATIPGVGDGFPLVALDASGPRAIYLTSGLMIPAPGVPFDPASLVTSVSPLPGRAGADRPIAGPVNGAVHDGLDAVTHAAGSRSFGPPEQILPGPGAFVDGAAVAIDAASGAVLATWRNVGPPVGWSVRAPVG